MIHIRTILEAPVFLWGASFLGGFAWLNPANLNGQITAIVGAGTTIVLGYISLSQMIDKRRHERRKLELEDEVTRAKALDDLRRETLTGQLQDMKISQDKLRKSLDEMNEEASRRGLEATAARHELAEANRIFIQVSAQLAEANKHISELTGTHRGTTPEPDGLLQGPAVPA